MVPQEVISISSEKVRRSIGRIASDESRPTIAFFAGIHGNEPAGIIALERVIKFIEEMDIPFHGNLWALQGNLPALREGKRYLDKDLNRIWLTKYNDINIERAGVSELKQRLELEKNILKILDETKGEVYFFDLHTTSSQSIPFISISDTLRNREVVEDVPVPVILGLEEQMEGTLFNFFGELGISMILFEAGQHDSVASVDNHEAFIWLILEKLKFIRAEKVPEFHKYPEILAKESLFNRQIFQLIHSHSINEGDEFIMNPGFVNFQKINKNQELAEDKDGLIIAPKRGRIFMPLYQQQGAEGFFIINEIRIFWLNLSVYLRKLRLDRFMHFLPGVRKHKDLPECFRVNRHIAKFFVLEFFHLLGYRKVVRKDNKFIVKRRAFDTYQPPISVIKKRFYDVLKSNGSM